MIKLLDFIKKAYNCGKKFLVSTHRSTFIRIANFFSGPLLLHLVFFFFLVVKYFNEILPTSVYD